MKVKTFSLIEEYYPEVSGLAEDEDVLNKINSVVNQIQMDLMPYRKINASQEFEIELNDDREVNLIEQLDDCYQIDKIIFDDDVDYELINDNTLILPDDFEGTFKVYYFKYPNLVKVLFKDNEDKDKYDQSFQFDLDKMLLEIMPYGIAADLLKMDMISNYGQYFYTEYRDRKERLDTRQSAGSIRIVGGVDI